MQPKKTCKVCGLSKNATKVPNRHVIDELGRHWYGKTCPDCFKKTYKPIKTIHPPKPCAGCNKIFTPKSKASNYCTFKCYHKHSYQPNKRKYKNCVTCGNNLSTKSRYCSKECKPRKSNVQATLICSICLNSYIKTGKRQKYCSKKCHRRSSSYKQQKKQFNNSEKGKRRRKEYRRLRKRAMKQAKPKWVSWKEIEGIYKNRPPEHEVDHIIPLKNPLVCGLHVPWNLQYLTKEENRIKSNHINML